MIDIRRCVNIALRVGDGALDEPFRLDENSRDDEGIVPYNRINIALRVGSIHESTAKIRTDKIRADNIRPYDIRR